MTHDDVISFLMTGDCAIRWQTQRDLLDAPEPEWEQERRTTAAHGWGRQFLALLNQDGNWPAGRWTGNVWTLCQLVDLGVSVSQGELDVPFENVVSRLMPLGKPVDPVVLKCQMDLCHLGFWLKIGCFYFSGDARLPELAETILSMQLADGGWNCRVRTKPETTHSSFHTTFNVLEGLRLAMIAGIIETDRFSEAQSKAIEFLLDHKLYCSDKTGELVNRRFLNLTFPSYWHFTAIRGLDYLSRTLCITDPRLHDALDYLENRQRSNGRWPVEKRIPGATLFEMEKMGGDSRWNTLRALRILRSAGRIGIPGLRSQC